MGTDWQAGDPLVPADDDAPREPASVVSYVAVVSVQVERAEVRVEPGADEARIRSAAALPPGWVEEWPPAELRDTDLGALPLATVGLAKLAALLDFNAELDAYAPDDIDEEITRRWPQVGQAVVDARGERFEQAVVEASVREDGTAVWGYTWAGAGGRPLPQFAQPDAAKRGEYEVFLQNVVRADLRRRLVAAAEQAR
jgi:hypothetical protein